MITPDSISAMLKIRTPETYKLAHVLETSEGLWCLDLDVKAPDRETMRREIEQATELKIVPDEAWLRFAQAPHTILTPSCKCKAATKGILVAVIIRSEVNAQ